jgi:hypothetical protein
MKGGHAQLAKRLECALLIAQVTDAWAWLEFYLGSMFAVATGTPERQENGNVIIRHNRVARAAFNELESLNARLRIIEGSLEAVLPQAVVTFQSLAKDIRRCAKNRNNVVHSRWSTVARYPRDLINQDDERWTPEDFSNVIKRIDEHSTRIIMFLAEHEKMREKAPPSEPIDDNQN